MATSKTVPGPDDKPKPKLNNFFSESITAPKKTYYAYLPGLVDTYLNDNVIKQINSLPTENFFDNTRSAFEAAKKKYPNHAITVFKIEMTKTDMDKCENKTTMTYNFNLSAHLKEISGIAKNIDFPQRKIYAYAPGKNNTELRKKKESRIENLKENHPTPSKKR